MRKIIFLSFLMLFVSDLAKAQFFKKDSPLMFYASGSIVKPDKRLFDVGDEFYRKYLLDKGKNAREFHTEAGVLKQCVARKKWKGYIGVGLQAKFTDFPRPFERYLLGGDGTDLLEALESYSKYGIQIPFHFKKSPKEKPSPLLQFSAITNFTLLKRATIENDAFQKFVFKPDNIDFLVGFNLKIGRGAFLIQTRFLNLAWQDRVIFNDVLFEEVNPRFLRRRVDFYIAPKLQCAFWVPLSKK